MNKIYKRGFASIDPKRQREIASMGGKAAHASGNAYKWNSETAREAGKKGGRNRHKQG
jgi:general stress protein YciG